MTKAEFLKILEPFTDECEIVVKMTNISGNFFKRGNAKYHFAKKGISIFANKDRDTFDYFEKCEGKEKDAEGVIVIS